MIIGIFCVVFLGFSLWLMKVVFQSLAFEVLQKTQERVNADLEVRQQSLHALLSPLSESVQKLDEYQRQLEQRREGAYAGLRQHIEEMTVTQRELRRETQQLSSALRSPPVRGAWGQVHLRRVVELAGLLNHCDFSEQSTQENEGKMFRPDLVVHLPGQREIVVDAKTPLNAFLEAVAASDENMRRKHLEAHALQLKKHIRELAQKDYWKRLNISPEFVVLFLPAEAFFSEALHIDSSLIETGAEQNVIVATPTTLIAILRAVAHGWKQEALSKNAEQIARLGQELYERLVVLSDHWEKVGKSLTSSIDSYNQAVRSLESRVLVTARKLKEHGAAPLTPKELEPLESIDRAARLPS
jgi:DNA recombination protein RmuC